MIPNGSMEQSFLRVRINELERRLARLEALMSEAGLDADVTTELGLGAGDGTDPRAEQSRGDAPDA